MTLNNDEIINSLKGKVLHLKLKKKTNNNCIRAKYSLLTKTLTIKLKNLLGDSFAFAFAF